MQNELEIFHRYMHDVWFFGIMLKSGKVIGVECILDIHDDYIEVSLLQDFESINKLPYKVICAPCSRARAIIRKENIEMIFELMDS